MTTTAILTAAGSGQRLGAELPKALVLIKGQPIVRIAAENLISSEAVDEIIVTVPAGYEAQFETALAGLKPAVMLAIGGETRQDSIMAALTQLSLACDKVLVHDAARPFTPPALIAQVANAISGEVSAVIPALPVTDTIKQVAVRIPALPSSTTLYSAQNDGLVTATLNRETLVAVQTPQGFDRGVLENAYRNASGKGIQGTDDASLVEALGIPVKAIPGDAAAMKITTPTDLKIAELLYGGAR
jgi:2-C-methyl-D-erythritol 4-phosphate cytidylyltransferase